MNNAFVFAFITAPVLVAACTDVQSADVKTAGMSAHMSVIANGSGQVVASAQLNVDTNLTDFVTLSNGDQLVASVAGQSEVMTETDIANAVSYSATFNNGPSAAATLYTIAFNRTSDTSAPSSTCTLPTPITISSPAPTATASRATSVTVTYAPSGMSDAMTYSVAGSGCVNGTTAAPINGDPGTFTIPASILTPEQGYSPSAMCQVTVAVIRTRAGQLDPAFGSGGEIQCVQQQSVTFNLTP